MIFTFVRKPKTTHERRLSEETGPTAHVLVCFYHDLPTIKIASEVDEARMLKTLDEIRPDASEKYRREHEMNVPA